MRPPHATDQRATLPVVYTLKVAGVFHSPPLSYVVRGTEHLVECGMAASVVGSALQLVAARLPDAAAARAMVGGAAIDATKLLVADASMGEWLERHGIAELGAELGDTDI